MVPLSALQITAGAGTARCSDGAQAGAGQASRYRYESPRHSAGVRPEGRIDDTAQLRRPYSRTGGRAPNAAGGCGGLVARPREPWRAIGQVAEAVGVGGA